LVPFLAGGEGWRIGRVDVGLLFGGSGDGTSEFGPARAEAVTRSDFLRLAAIGGAGLLVHMNLHQGGSPQALAAPSRDQDIEILNFALLLEYIERAFYDEAVASGALDGELLEFAREVGRHERAHVALLEGALGKKARPEPELDFGDATGDMDRFAATAVVLEDLGVGAYVGQGANLTRAYRSTAARIASVEGRHAAWIRDIVGKNPAPHAADKGLTAREVSSLVDETGFLN
jgi:hypothetical protein